MSALDHHLGEDLLAMAEGGAGLSPARKVDLEAHLATCAECQAAIASAKLVLRVVDAHPVDEPSPAFDRALFARLDEIDRRVPFLQRVKDFFTVPKIGFAFAAGAAAAALAVAVIYVDNRHPNDSAMTVELAMNLEGLRVAENLDLYKNLEVIENLDVLDDLDAIQALEEEPG
jgi:hypothetical protein